MDPFPVNDQVDSPSAFLETMRCPIGCDAETSFVLSGRDRLHNIPGQFTLVRCNACGLMRTDPRPNAKAIERYYPADYSPHKATRRDDVTLLDYVAACAHVLLDAWRVPALPPGRLLEFGCGPGNYLKWMGSRGWNVRGIEPSPIAAEHARNLGLNVHTGSIETAPEPDAPYDLSVGWMVVEHLHDPVASLRKVGSWTRPGGWIAVSVPNAQSWEFTRFGTYWYALDLPRHLYHFTPTTITMLLAEAGWHVRKILYQRSFDNVVASFGYRLASSARSGIRSGLARAFINFPTNVPLHFLTFPFLFPLAAAVAAVRQTGRMTIWAQRDS